MTGIIAIVCWMLVSTGNVFCSDPVPIEEAREIAGSLPQNIGRDPVVFKEGSDVFLQVAGRRT